ncbi:hypothetical protein OH77DRAFT_1586618 [Trametes cingulata]|nr:hypothetical protein OH77DRAFT_1586618 [Trametes cingulata]
MATMLVPDFVIKRRRKRLHHPVDPCLGFYQDTAQPPVYAQPPISLHASRTEERPHTITSLQEHATVISRADGHTRCEKAPPCTKDLDAEENPVALTVEAFLRHATSPVKHYTRRGVRNRKRRNSIRRTSEDEYQPSSDDPESDDSEERISSRSPRKRRRREVHWTSDEDEGASTREVARRRRGTRRMTQALSTRLLLAGASTGVDLVGGPLLPAVTSNRQPIPLVPHHRLPSPLPHTRVALRHYVDPRSSVPLRRASYQFSAPADDQPASSVKHSSKPVTAWKPDGPGALQQPESSRPLTPATPQRLVTVPLVLVPVTTTMARDRANGSTPSGTKTARSVPRPKHRATPSRSAIPFGSFIHLSPKHQTLKSSALGLEQCSAFFLPKSSPPRPSTRVLDGSLTSPPLDPSSATHGCTPDYLLTSGLITGSSPNCDGSELPVEAPMAVYLSPSAPLVHSSPDDALLLRSTTLDCEVSMDKGHSAAPKPMKSLVTLMDGFREIARSATQKSEVPARIRKRPRLRPSRGLSGHSDRAVQLPPNASSGLQAVAGIAASACLPAVPCGSALSSDKPPVRVRHVDGLCSPSAGEASDPCNAEAARSASANPLSTQDDRRSPLGVDVLSILQRSRRNILHLPSSPLPGWSVLPSDASHVGSEYL